MLYASANCGFFDTVECLNAPARCIPNFKPMGGSIIAPENVSATANGYVRELHLAGSAPQEGRGCSPSSRSAVAYTAVPIESGSSGRHTFCIDSESLTVCINNSGEVPAVENGICKLTCDQTY